METALAKPVDNYSINSSSMLIIPNGDVDEYQVFDIEMFTIEEAEGYTSLRDLLLSSPSSSMKNSWKEIPIKDPLVQHAAWAYLQPMAAPQGHHRNFIQKLKDKCCGVIRCFHDVVFVMFRGWFVRETEEEDELQVE